MSSKKARNSRGTPPCGATRGEKKRKVVYGRSLNDESPSPDHKSERFAVLGKNQHVSFLGHTERLCTMTISSVPIVRSMKMW